MGQTQRVSRTATSIRQEDGDTVIQYHKTDVVRFNGKTLPFERRMELKR